MEEKQEKRENVVRSVYGTSRDIQTIPVSCRERFISFQNMNDRAWPDGEVSVAGISDITEGYSIHRVCSLHHVLIYVMSGELHCEIGLGEPGVIPAGHLLFLAAGGVHLYRADAPARIMWFHLIPEADCWRRIALSESFTRLSECEISLHDVLEVLHREASPCVTPDGVMLNMLSRVAIMYLYRELDHNRKQDQHIRLRKAFQKVSANPAHDWTVGEVARLAGMSEPNLYLVCRQLYGKSPGTMLHDVRMNCAAKLLCCTGHKLDMIAEQTGFSCGFALSRAFRRYFKISPGEYRKRFSGQFDEEGTPDAPGGLGDFQAAGKPPAS